MTGTAGMVWYAIYWGGNSAKYFTLQSNDPYLGSNSYTRGGSALGTGWGQGFHIVQSGGSGNTAQVTLTLLPNYVQRILQAFAIFGTEDGGRKMHAAVLRLPASVERGTDVRSPARSVEMTPVEMTPAVCWRRWLAHQHFQRLAPISTVCPALIADLLHDRRDQFCAWQSAVERQDCLPPQLEIGSGRSSPWACSRARLGVTVVGAMVRCWRRVFRISPDVRGPRAQQHSLIGGTIITSVRICTSSQRSVTFASVISSAR